MCGLAGFTGIADNAQRYALMRVLGLEIDERGGHAAGFVSVSKRGAVRHLREVGPWWGASLEFLRLAGSGSRLTMLHSRYATSGGKWEEECAHPFEVVRRGQTALWGAHNGVLWGTHETATARGRDHDVDSRELFELLADQELDAIRTLQGYGAITWIEGDAIDRVKLCRISAGGELVLARIADGGFAWASTRKILTAGLHAAGLTAASWIDLKEGQVYNVYAEGVTESDQQVTVGDFTRATTQRYLSHGWHEESQPSVPDYGLWADTWGLSEGIDEGGWVRDEDGRWKNLSDMRVSEMVPAAAEDTVELSDILARYAEGDRKSRQSRVRVEDEDRLRAEAAMTFEDDRPGKLRSWAESDGYTYDED